VPVECECPGCDAKFLLADEMAGTRVRCVECGTVFDVAQPGGLSPVAAVEKSGGRWTGAVALTAVVVLLSGALLAAFLVPAVRRARADLRRDLRKAAVLRLASALVMYAREYDDRLPYDARGPMHSLALLYPAYVQDPEAFLAPVETDATATERPTFPPDTSLAGRPCSYVYSPPGAPGWPEPDRIVLTELPTPGAAGRYVVYADGRVGWVRKTSEPS